MSNGRSVGSGGIRSHRDLRVLRLGLALAKRVRAVTAGFSEAERFGLALQLRRASVSVPSNIAEGFARGSARDYARFLVIALGSIGELETQLLIARDLPGVDAAEIDALLALLTAEGQMLNRLCESVRRSGRRPSAGSSAAQPSAGGRGPRAEGRGPRAEGRGPSAECRGPSATHRAPRGPGRGPQGPH